MAGEVPRERRVLVVLGGGIGAGKSTVGEVFRRNGFVVLSADEVGRDVLAVGSPTVDLVARRWPAIVDGGVVDRGALANIVFADADELAALEAMTHPEIRRRLAAALDDVEGPTLVEVPLMGVIQDDDAVRVAVVATPEVRLARAVARGGDADDVRRRMMQQPTDEAWSAWADIVVDTNGAWFDTERVVESVVGEVLADG